MQAVALSQALAGDVLKLMSMGEPYVSARTPSDYWLYARLFSSTCPVVLDGEAVVGAAIAMRSQVAPDEVYVQDVMTHPKYRRLGISRMLLDVIRSRAEQWGCRRIYLTSEPENTGAYAAWTSYGFVNHDSDYRIGDMAITKDFKGPGKDRAVFEISLD